MPAGRKRPPTVDERAPVRRRRRRDALPHPVKVSRATRTLQTLFDPGPVRVATAVVALVIVSVCGFQSALGVGKPFPGFFVWENLFVPAVGQSHWTGVTAGLEYHSWIVAVDGTPIADARELDAALAGKRDGDPVVYRVRKGDTVRDVTVPVSTFTLRDYAASTGMYLFDAVALMALAIVVIYLKPRGRDAGSLFAFATILALDLATSIDMFGPYTFRAPYFFFAGMAPTAAFGVLSYFPVGRTRRRWEDAALGATALAGLAFAIESNRAFFDDTARLLALDRAYHVYVAATIVAAAAFFAFHFANARDHEVRQRTKVVLLSILWSFLPIVALLATYAGLLAIPLNLLTVSVVIFPVGIGYAIAKHDLFDIDRVIKRALAYTALSAVVFTVYALGITVFELAFEDRSGLAQRFTSGLLTLALLLALNPSRQRIQALVDRLYDRRRYEVRDVVRSASRRFSSILDFESLVRAALELIDETVQPQSAELYTVATGGEITRRARLRYEDNARTIDLVPDAAPELAPVVAAMRTSDLVTTRGQSPATARPDGDGAALGRYGGVLATAMKLEGRLAGILVVGEKRSGGYHTGDDADLLRTMSDQLAVALENAQAYHTIGSLNVDLESKNAALERANDELQNAQEQLIRSERLAAVGELAGAVAHAIRNPLAGIKMAAEWGADEFAESGARGNFDDITSEAQRLEDRITSLLDFARPFEPHPTDVRLDDIVQGAVDASRGKAEQRQVSLRYDHDHPPLPAKLDPPLFEQVVIELLANAIDASPAGASVVVETRPDPDKHPPSALLTVTDAGPGIPEDKRPRIFDLFFTTKKTGTGFGLATVKKVVERHGGTVAVAESGGSGTRFVVEVPLAESP